MNNNDSKGPKKPEEPGKISSTEPQGTAQKAGSQKGADQKASSNASSNASSSCSTSSCKFFSLAASNKEQTAVYLLLVLGFVILLFFHNFIGELIIGGVAGWGFASGIVYYLRNLKQIFSGQDQLRYVVLTAVLLGLFIEAPGIFIGALIVAAFKQVFAGSDSAEK